MFPRNSGAEASLLLFSEGVNQVSLNYVMRAPMSVTAEMYSNERKAEFLLNNAIDDDDYSKARKEVQKLGLDPDLIPHQRPS